MRRLLAAIIAITAALGTTGCIEKETTSTIYLEPDGRATWVVVETNIRSDEDTPQKRSAEEAGYLARVTGTEPPVATALRLAGARQAATRVVRREAPFALVTEAEFDRITDIFATALESCRLVSSSSLGPEGNALRWSLDVLVDIDGDNNQPDGCPDLSALSDALDNLRLISVGGVIHESVGFTRIAPDEVELTDSDDDALAANGGWWHLSLVWGAAALR